MGDGEPSNWEEGDLDTPPGGPWCPPSGRTPSDLQHAPRSPLHRTPCDNVSLIPSPLPPVHPAWPLSRSGVAAEQRVGRLRERPAAVRDPLVRRTSADGYAPSFPLLAVLAAGGLEVAWRPGRTHGIAPLRRVGEGLTATKGAIAQTLGLGAKSRLGLPCTSARGAGASGEGSATPPAGTGQPAAKEGAISRR